MIHEGGCHCGDLRYRLLWPEASGALPARRCACSYCTRFSAAWTSHPHAQLEFGGPGAERVQTYRFGTETADFLFCGRCGVTLAAVCDVGGGLKAIINVNTLDQRGELVFDRSDCDFGGETPEQRLARRAQHWIGKVSMQAPA